MMELIEKKEHISDLLDYDQNRTELNRFSLKSNIKLILFTSHTPCTYSTNF